MKKARVRLQALVERSGILVFASHSNEFLAQLCDTAMWIDHGQIRQQGGIEDVVRAYEGDDAADHVRHVIYELDREKSGLTASGERDARSDRSNERPVRTAAEAEAESA